MCRQIVSVDAKVTQAVMGRKRRQQMTRRCFDELVSKEAVRANTVRALCADAAHATDAAAAIDLSSFSSPSSTPELWMVGIFINVASRYSKIYQAVQPVSHGPDGRTGQNNGTGVKKKNVGVQN